jgi:hypothetical protein
MTKEYIMEYKVLEANSVENENVDGGAINNLITGGESGIVAGVLNECSLVSTGKTLTMSTGLLLIKGIRVKIISPADFSITGSPSVALNYHLVASVQLNTDRSVLFRAFVEPVSNLTKDDIYKTESGTFELEIATFIHDTDGSIKNLVRACPLLTNINTNNSNITIDTTLTKSGMAADAKVVGDKFAKIEELLYKKIDLSSFYVSPSIAEKGSEVTRVELSWSVNKTPTSLTLDGLAIDKNSTSKTLNGLSLTTTKTYTLKATDEKGATDTAYAYVRFYNGVYYGVATKPNNYDSAFIKSLERSLQSSKSNTFIVTAGAGQYIYYALPTSYGTPNFNVGGFDGGFTKVGTIPFTNASGYTENYDIYRSENANLGYTTVKVS